MKPSCLLIGGFDPSSGAGVSADIRTCDRLGVHPFSIITAVTYQTFKVFHGYHPLTREQLTRQLDAVLKHYPVKHVKIGMIPNEECLNILAKYIKEYNLDAILDPVTVSSAGERLSTENLELSMKKILFPLVRVITPNLKEARKFSGISRDLDFKNMDHLKKLTSELLQAMMPLFKEEETIQNGEKAVIIKTALKREDNVFDVSMIGTRKENKITTEFQLHEKKYIQIKGNVHGTGCVFASAIAASLARGSSLKVAIESAELYFDERFQQFIEDPKGGKALDLTLPIDHVRLMNQIKELYSYISSKRSFSKLIPEVRMNISGALPNAQTKSDVAGIEGRVTVINGFPHACGEIKFGASDHTARLLLTAKSHDPSINFVMNLKYYPELIDLLKEQSDLVLHEIKRSEQPEKVRKKDESTMQWLIKESMRKTGTIPDIIWDTGAMGKEPMMRLFGKSSREMLLKLEKIIKIAEKTLEMRGA